MNDVIKVKIHAYIVVKTAFSWNLGSVCVVHTYFDHFDIAAYWSCSTVSQGFIVGAVFHKGLDGDETGRSVERWMQLY
jgi:hypothetical protein